MAPVLCQRHCAHKGLEQQAELDRLIGLFGRDRVLVELWDHGDPLDHHRNDAMVEIAHRSGVECVAANAVTHATTADAGTMAVAAMGGRSGLHGEEQLFAHGASYLRSGVEQARRFQRCRRHQTNRGDCAIGSVRCVARCTIVASVSVP